VGKGRGLINNRRITTIFADIADILDLKGKNVLRIRAYRRAACNR
jgi:DNA polymerase/3'-5' exonuclease PolX